MANLVMRLKRRWQGGLSARTRPGHCLCLAMVLILLERTPACAQSSQPTDQTEVPTVTPVPQDEDAAKIPQDDFSLDMDPLMDVGVLWPDLNAKEAAGKPYAGSGNSVEPLANADEGAAPIQAGSETPNKAADDTSASIAPIDNGFTDDGSERRYTVALTGLDVIADGLFRQRFNALSLLKEREGKPANLAQINRRMRSDAELLDRLLRAKGYYDATIKPSVRAPESGDGGRVRVTLDVAPGDRYTLSRISLPGLAIAEAKVPELRAAFPVKIGQSVDADAILAGQSDLAAALGENGFPFAKVDEPVVTVDHEVRTGDLEMVVRAGGYRRFGDIVLDDRSSKLFSPRHLYRIARFHEGDVYQASDVEDLRRAIVATGLVSSATVTPRDGHDGEHADIAVAVSPARMRTIAGELGYGTGEGYRVEASWQNRNFFPPEGAITVRGLLGTKEQAAGITYRRNNFLKRDHILSAGISARHQSLDAFEARTISLITQLERQTNIIYQKKWAWSIGAELTGSRERDIFAGTQTETQRDYLIAALPGSVTFDASDDLLDPTRGFRLGIRISPEVAEQGGAFAYVRAQVDGSTYLPLSDRLVFASRVRLGSILTSVSADRIAPSRRFYAGGGASVRGYAYQAIGPRDPNNKPLGGKSLAEFSLEARIRFGTFGVVPFIDAGNISTQFLPRLDNIRYGTGVGLRYYSSFGPIRIDVGTPLNRQPGDSRIAVYVSLGQAF